MSKLIRPAHVEGVKLVLLYDTKNDDGIRLFLHEAWEVYVKACYRISIYDKQRRTNGFKHTYTLSDPPEPF